MALIPEQWVPGMCVWVGLVAFDPDTVADTASFKAPTATFY